jgi:hypothetical protein
MSANDGDFDYVEYFSGYVPSGAVFLLAANDILKIAAQNQQESHSCVNGLCLIGLVAYFEAFAKDQLSSIISLAPELIEELKHAGCPTDIPAQEAYEYRENLKYKIGFVLGERIDLGSANKINAIFTKLLQITPLGAADAIHYEKLLRDRNLLVHHGGTYTTSYIRQAVGEIPPERRRPHADTLVIPFARVRDDVAFLKKIAQNLVSLSSRRLEGLLKKTQLAPSKEIADALSFMAWWDDVLGDDKTVEKHAGTD